MGCRSEKGGAIETAYKTKQIGPTGHGEEVNFFFLPAHSFTLNNNTKTPSFFKILKPQMFIKSHKLKYHFGWISTLIMNLSLDFTVNVFIKRKVNNNFEFKKNTNTKNNELNKTK